MASCTGNKHITKCKHILKDIKLSSHDNNRINNKSFNLSSHIFDLCRYSHGRDILSLTGVLGKITIKEYTCIKKTKKTTLIIRNLSSMSFISPAASW